MHTDIFLKHTAEHLNLSAVITAFVQQRVLYMFSTAAQVAESHQSWMVQNKWLLHLSYTNFMV